VLGAIILWKEYSFRLVMKRSIETNSSSLKADAWHHRSDAITSVAAFTGISIALLMGGYDLLMIGLVCFGFYCTIATVFLDLL
jgi:divalent metal cation (Fe/Co/Zn/Cd) transporter